MIASQHISSLSTNSHRWSYRSESNVWSPLALDTDTHRHTHARTCTDVQLTHRQTQRTGSNPSGGPGKNKQAYGWTNNVSCHLCFPVDKQPEDANNREIHTASIKRKIQEAPQVSNCNLSHESWAYHICYRVPTTHHFVIF